MTSLMQRLANKVGIITASGSGMGRAGAFLFASEGARCREYSRQRHLPRRDQHTDAPNFCSPPRPRKGPTG